MPDNAAPDRPLGFATRSLHAGHTPDKASLARAVPIYQTTSFVFEDSVHAAELFALQKFGNIYSRIMNPTTDVFEQRVASLEGGIGGLATSSGQAAQFLAITSLLGPGDELVSAGTLYGGTYTQFDVSFRRLGIDVKFVEPDDPENFRKAITPKTRAVYAETIANPRMNVLDIARVADIAHAAGVPLIVDNTMVSPYLCRPIEHGADVVVHSATKFIGGHGTVIAGVLVESGTFDWGAGRHPLVSSPSPGYHGLNFSETFGEYAYLMRARAEVLRDVGACLSPMNAWLLVQGLETLAVRMEAHVANARRVADFLAGHQDVAWVKYAGLRDDPSHALAVRYLPRGAGSIFTFAPRGGREAAVRFIEALEIWSHLANVGDAKSLVIHPMSTTHL